MLYSNKKIIHIISNLLLEKKIYNLVISPGSRNAPIIIHFTNHKPFKTYFILDERSAGFFALGISQYIQHPVVINSTSGSAITNYYPAIVEAFYQKIPLIIITADRPKSDINIYQGQTINQENIFVNHTVKSIDLDENYSKKDFFYKKRLINESINACLIKKQPIHLNIHLSEPLYKIITRKIHINKSTFDPIFNTTTNIFFLIKKLKKIWESSKKKMFLIGQNEYNKKKLNILLKNINKKDPSVIILTESISNVNNVNYINNIDRIVSKTINKQSWNKIKPDILITIGRNIISKNIKILLEKYEINHHWNIEENTDYSNTNSDTYNKLTFNINTCPLNFLKNIYSCCNIKKSYYKKLWLKIQKNKNKRHNFFLTNLKFSDFKVLEAINKKIPINSNLHIGNSSVIRYHQIINRKKIFCYSNRGVSGIEGSMSTAIGFSIFAKKQTTVIIGDLSFFYESSILCNKYIPKNFRIILINNGGGDIFNLIKGPNKNIKKILIHPHNLNAKNICKTYSIKYYISNDYNNLLEILSFFWKKNQSPMLLEINTKNINNNKILNQYFDYI